jgi:aromatic-amino-acid transaminase
MFERLTPPPPDTILALMQAFRDDPRAHKIDLGVGVWRDAAGRTPVMRAVRAAERAIWEAETTKTYTALAGEPAFGAAMAELILGAGHDAGRVAFAAQPGGTGAVRQALELVRIAAPGATLWLSDPTWPNHVSIAAHLGLPMRRYRYFDAATGGVDLGGLLADLGRAAAGDVVLLHGSCHNPTGANPAPADWAEIARLLADRGLTPLVDLAYQGFGDGLEADAAPTRTLARTCPEVLIAASCSKNFGIYRERTGILLALGDSPEHRDRVQGALATLNRVNFSFPPDHGARVVTTVLTDPALRADWEAELADIRSTMIRLREALARALAEATGSDRFGFVAAHRGMFSRLGLGPGAVERLRRDFAIYMVGDSRINVAGLSDDTIPRLAQAVAAVSG